MVQEWEAAAEAKRKEVLGRIPAEWRLASIPSVTEQKDVTGDYIRQFLDAKEVEITESDSTAIISKVASGAWTAVDVTTSFCHRAAVSHQLTKCLHEIFFDAAIEDAKQLDAYFAKERKTKGPLHGLPVSLKDQFHVKDVETTMGYVSWLGTFQGKANDPRYKSHESEMVRELRDLGAVLYCKTSVPYTLMSGETVNNFVGLVLNPKNRNLVSGGSSGGEGALIALKGSPMGVGSDIGGSIRIPAGFNGLFGLRPSSGRPPYEGAANTMDGQNSCVSVVGPLGSTVQDLQLFTKSILSQKPWLHDPMVVDMPWRDAEEQSILDRLGAQSEKRLSFAVLENDGAVSPHPPVARAMRQVIDALRNAGHRIIEWKPPGHLEGIQSTLKAMNYDGGKDVMGDLSRSGEYIAPQISVMYSKETKPEATASDIAANNVDVRDWKKTTMEYWNATADDSDSGLPIDAIIAPVAPFAAARPTRFLYYGYTFWVNGLDWTSVALPVTVADKTIDLAIENFKPVSELDGAIQSDYDADIYDGAPVAVQIIGRRFTEEKTLAITQYVHGLLKVQEN